MYDAKWRFLDSGAESAVFHMALDEAVLDAVSSGESSPTFRLFEWKPAAVTLGFSQKAGAGIDYDRCVADGITVTRRLTGGRAVLHDRELAYSVVGRVDDPVFGGSIMDTYREISRVILNALSALGADAEWSRGVQEETSTPGGATGPAPCFLSASRYEITIGGKKLVGSAQRRIGKVFLQQGSILTGPGHERIVDYLVFRENAERLSGALMKKSVDLSTAMLHPIHNDDLKRALYDALTGMCRRGNVFLGEPSPKEMDRAHRFMNERYGSKGWVMGYETHADL